VSAFKKATKSQSKLRAAVFGPSGSGKTFTSLRIAAGLGGPIAVIDSERGSASKYADRFSFDVCELADKTIEGYSRAIREAGKAGYGVLVIDSLSHAWQELLEQIDALAKTKYKGNTWSAWSDGTPKQRKLVDAILEYPGHVLATMRSKTEWQTGEGKGGKTQPIRVGLAPEQGKGIEYEFDLLLEINPDHQATVLKDRTGKFQDRILDRPGEDFGRDLAAWLNEGEPARVMASPGPNGDGASETGRPASGTMSHSRAEVSHPEKVPPRDDAPDDPMPDKAPRALSWAAYLARSCSERRDYWHNELAIANIPPEERKRPENLLPDQYQVLNHMVTRAVGSGAIRPEAISKGGTADGSRDTAKAKVAMADLFARAPKKIAAAVDAYFREKERELRVRLGMDDMDDTTAQDRAEDASQEQEAAVGREPGSDDER